MNGANIGTFDLNSPPDTESMALTDDRIRSLKSTVQQVLDDEHSFPSAGGANVGYHRLGSARAYVGTQSQVSSSGTDGRLMVASDTSRLFGVGSGGTVMYGGPNVISAGTTVGVSFPQRSYWAMEWGFSETGSSGSVRITIPNSGFSGIPLVFITGRVPSVASTMHSFAHYPEDTGASFIVSAINGAASVFVPNQQFAWLSIGTRAL